MNEMLTNDNFARDVNLRDYITTHSIHVDNDIIAPCKGLCRRNIEALFISALHKPTDIVPCLLLVVTPLPPPMLVLEFQLLSVDWTDRGILIKLYYSLQE